MAIKDRMTTVTFRTRAAVQACPVLIGSGLLAGSGWLEAAGTGPVFLVSDHHVFPRYGEKVVAALRGRGCRPTVVLVPAGERAKSLYQLDRLYRAAREAGLERGTPVLALGGGVVTDLAGFFAGTWLRGLPLVNLPTTLLGQVDAALGGKNGINVAALKNQAGTFHQPRLVACDTDTLRTLPPRAYRGGLAEVVKCGIIRDPRLFALLESRAAALGRRDEKALLPAVIAAVRVKARVVAADAAERSGEREVLNFGHTIGHGLETAAGCRRLTHGEAVAAGMVVEADIARGLGLLEAADFDAIGRVLQRLGLPRRVTGLAAAEVRRAMTFDKKNKAGRIAFILPTAIGTTVRRDDVPDDAVAAALDRCLS